MQKPFLEYLDDNVVVCDGAMGTQLYAKGVFLNRCFDELNLSCPSIVREVHQEYLWAGAEILETNTFGANRMKLEPHGLGDRVREINRSGVEIAREVARAAAYVGGSVGPLGIRIEPYGKMGLDEARGIFAEQIAALVEAGVDLLCLETFSDLNEIHAALLAARDVCDLPVMAQISLEEDGNSREGSPPERFAADLEKWGADLIGVNCGVGPQVMLESVERMAKVVSRRLVAQPNAGKPRYFEGRNLYLSSPEYLASYARRFIRAGVQVVGGCCGTTPAHIQSIRSAVRTLRATRIRTAPAPVVENVPEVEIIPVAQRSRVARLIHEEKPLVIVEMMPPQGSDAAPALDSARLLKDQGVDAITISEAPYSRACMGSLALAVLLETRLGLETILQYTCRERGLLVMQSELLGVHALGLRNILLATGEPMRVGLHDDVTTVVDVDSVGVTHLVAGLNRGHDVGGKAIGKPTGFFIGVQVNPGALNLEDEVRRLEYKVEAGAEFAITQPLFRPDLLERFIDRARDCRIPLLAGISPLASLEMAEFIHNEVPGISIPAALLARMRKAGSPEEERREGIAIARELMAALK
ncbi:MAG: bifunctional homocysteine S-methyltransferase/methylenetetrahydrofolate reductase, partial [Gammaproteobacteria bacterium]